MNIREPLTLNSPELRSTKKAIGSLVATNCIIYGAILTPLTLCTELDFAAYSIAVILAYNIMESFCLFGCKAYNWPLTLTFRIVWILHDFAYFITFAVFAPNYHSYSNSKYCIENDNDKRCKKALFPIAISCCILFLVTFGIGVATLIRFSKLPWIGCNCPTRSQVQPIIINLDGKTWTVQVPVHAVTTQQPSNIETTGYTKLLE